MRKSSVFTLSVFLLIFSTSFLFAQKISAIGLKAGGTYATFGGKDADLDFYLSDPDPFLSDFFSVDKNSAYGFALGGFLVLDMSDKLGFRPEFLYVQKGTEYQIDINFEGNDFFGDLESNIETTFQLNYLEIPLLLQYRMSSNPTFQTHIFAGPAISFYLNGKSTAKIESQGDQTGNLFIFEDNVEEQDINSDDIKSPDFGFVFGVGTTLHNRLSLDLRYHLGLRSLPAGDEEADEIDIKNQVISVMAGFYF